MAPLAIHIIGCLSHLFILAAVSPKAAFLLIDMAVAINTSNLCLILLTFVIDAPKSPGYL
ncbi:hypothetical protein BZG29_17150 [Janthinobacterium sp. LM6]|nr:hypothetical protein BZG29_17150 [Janthinobacterium sp. LM6]